MLLRAACLVYILRFDNWLHGVSWKIGSSSQNSCEDGKRKKETLVILDFGLVVGPQK